MTGLEKDNLRITWDEARRQLVAGCDIKIDVTEVKSSPNSVIWLVFGLYFSSINTSFSQFQEVLLNSSRAKHMKFERLFNCSDIAQTLNRENVQEVYQNSERKLLNEESFEILESSIHVQEDEFISSKFEEFVAAYDQSGLSFEYFLDTTPLLSIGCGKNYDILDIPDKTSETSFHGEDLKFEIQCDNFDRQFESLHSETFKGGDECTEADFVKVMADNKLLDTFDGSEIERILIMFLKQHSPVLNQKPIFILLSPVNLST